MKSFFALTAADGGRRTAIIDAVDEMEFDEDNLPDEPFDLIRQVDKYFARDELGRLRQTQEQITQTLAELAEQNTRLVDAVERLRKRTRLLMGAVLVLAVVLGALYFSAA